jgi:hypothetical protein
MNNRVRNKRFTLQVQIIATDEPELIRRSGEEILYDLIPARSLQNNIIVDVEKEIARRKWETAIPTRAVNDISRA